MIALVAGTLGTNAAADLKLDPYLGAGASYDSNIFALTSKAQAEAEDGGDPVRSDVVVKEVGGLNGTYTQSRQEFDVTAEGRHYEYTHFDRLNHDEYLLASHLKWAVGNTLDGAVDFHQELTLAPFLDRDNTQLSLLRERLAGAGLNYLITPEWRLETAAHDSKLLAPLQDGPTFTLKQDSGSVALKYLGVERLTSGIYVEYLDGSYVEDTGTTGFHQVTAELTTDYTVTDLYNIDGKLGYISRTGDKLPGITGSLAYTRKLTGKTSMNLQAFRRVTSYTAGDAALVESGVGLGVLWLPTAKISVSARYDWERADFETQNTSDTGDSTTQSRKDTLQSTSLIMNYQFRDWLLVQPYGRYQTRGSNELGETFNEAIVGLQVRGRFGGPHAAQSGAQVTTLPF